MDECKPLTGGPFPLGYHGLGDVTVVVFFGFVATGGIRYIHGGGDYMSVPTAVASLQVGLLCAALLAGAYTRPLFGST